MNKLYLLAALGVAVKADATGLSSYSDGWYAGDCFDQDSFSTYYGYVEYDCGTACAIDANNNTDDGTEYETEYPDCFDDDTWTTDEQWTCVAYSYSCYEYSADDEDTCEAAVVACGGDDTCSATAVCANPEYDTCDTDLATAIDDFETEWASYYNETSSGRVKKLKASSDSLDLTFRSGIYLDGMDTIDSSYPVYCDHYHLYNFGYDTVSPQDEADSDAELLVTGWSMVGFPNLCSYTDWLAIYTPVIEGNLWATSADQFAWTCGYYVQYEWNGNGDVWFEVASENAVTTAISAIALATVGSLLF